MATRLVRALFSAVVVASAVNFVLLGHTSAVNGNVHTSSVLVRSSNTSFIYLQHCPRTGGQSFSLWIMGTFDPSAIVPSSRPGHYIPETITVEQVGRG